MMNTFSFISDGKNLCRNTKGMQKERKKATNNEEYLSKERERRRRNYVPSPNLQIEIDSDEMRKTIKY
jgi:hypothetical protein